MRVPAPQCLTLTLAALTAGATAQPTGGFVALLDKQNNFGDSRQSVVFYSTDDLTSPLFSVFSGEKTPGDQRSPNSITVDPLTGDVYLLSDDRDAPAGTFVPGSPLDLIPDNTEGSYDLLRIPFSTLYNDWVTNQASAYTTYNPGPFGHPSGANTNEVQFNTSVEKIGEIARPEFLTGQFFDSHLEFVDQNTLLVVDRRLADTSVPANNIPANDSQIRAIRRVSTSPGAATVNGTLDVGGFNAGTTESWESVVLGQVLMDSTSVSEIDSVAFYRDAATGVQGLWILESDLGSTTPNPGPDGIPGNADDFIAGDQVAFFKITNLAGTAGNGLAELAVGGGPTFPNDFVLDDNPVLNSSSNDGSGDRIFVDPSTGKLVIIESGFFDGSQDEPAVITRDIVSYENTDGRIVPGGWTHTQLNGAFAGDDDTAVTDGRWTFYDHVNNDVYFYDLDTGDFAHDWIKLDLDTGVTTAVGVNADISNGLFSNGDQVSFFFLSAAGLDGDYNNNGQVEQGDLDLVLLNWGSDGTTPPAGWINDLPSGLIDQAELDGVLLNWGNTTEPGVSAVPEPATAALLALGGLAMLRRRAA